MTYTEINSLTVENSLITLLYKIRDFSEIGEEQHYYLVEDPCESNYNNLVVPHPSVTKPTLQEFENGLAIWKAELTATEDARLAEIARKNDLRAKTEVLKDRDSGMPAFYILMPQTSNVDQYIELLIEDSNRANEAEEFFQQLEAKDEDIVNGIVAQKQKDDRKFLGKLARDICVEVLDIIAGYNMERELTAEQVDVIQTMFMNIEIALRSARPHTAKAFIQAIIPDGTLVTQLMKDEVLDAMDYPEIGL